MPEPAIEDSLSPKRIGLSGVPSIAELLGRVRAVTLAAQDNQDLPFEQVGVGVDDRSRKN